MEPHRLGTHRHGCHGHPAPPQVPGGVGPTTPRTPPDRSRGNCPALTSFVNWRSNERAMRRGEPLPRSVMPLVLCIGIVVVGAVAIVHRGCRKGVAAVSSDEDPNDPGLARERTALSWNRSGLAIIVCIAVVLRHLWPLNGTDETVRARHRRCRSHRLGVRLLSLYVVAVSTATDPPRRTCFRPHYGWDRGPRSRRHDAHAPDTSLGAERHATTCEGSDSVAHPGLDVVNQTCREDVAPETLMGSVFTIAGGDKGQRPARRTRSR